MTSWGSSAFLQSLAKAGIILAATYLLAQLFPRLLSPVSGRIRPHTRTVLRFTIGSLIWIVGVSTALQDFGLSILAGFGLGVIGAMVAVATPTIGQGLLAGVFLLAEGDYAIGDRIDVGAYPGATVEDFRFRSTVCSWTDPATSQTKIVVIPNQQLVASAFAVWRAPPEPLQPDAATSRRLLGWMQKWRVRAPRPQ